MKEAVDVAISSKEIIEVIYKQAQSYDVELRLSTLKEELIEDEIGRLPMPLREDEFMIFAAGESHEGAFDFPITMKDFSAATLTTESVALFDKHGDLVTIGPVALYLPR